VDPFGSWDVAGRVHLLSMAKLWSPLVAR
jgi:hypothetical protein